MEVQEDAEVCCGLHYDDTGMADATLVHIGAGSSRVWVGTWAAETTNAKTIQPLAFYIPEETKLLKDYYGAPLALCAGIDFVHNAECRFFLAELTEMAQDFTAC